MKAIKKQKHFLSTEIVIQFMSFMVFTLIALWSASSFAAESTTTKKTPTARVTHARELLGKHYQKKVLKKSSSGDSEISDFVKVTTRKFLPKSYQSSATKVSKAILSAAAKFDLDPVFVMAVILNESSFRPKMKGSAGEIGLMQIKPSTAVWISKVYKLPYRNDQSLNDPVVNIWLGTAYIDKLRKQFESHSQLYLSAYNIGAKKVRMMVSENKAPHEYVQAVMKRYMALYSGFRIEGSAQEQGEIAFHKTADITARKTIVKN